MSLNDENNQFEIEHGSNTSFHHLCKKLIIVITLQTRKRKPQKKLINSQTLRDGSFREVKTDSSGASNKHPWRTLSRVVNKGIYYGKRQSMKFDDKFGQLITATFATLILVRAALRL